MLVSLTHGPQSLLAVKLSLTSRCVSAVTMAGRHWEMPDTDMYLKWGRCVVVITIIN